jgi:hypothetical protein
MKGLPRDRSGAEIGRALSLLGGAYFFLLGLVVLRGLIDYVRQHW